MPVQATSRASSGEGHPRGDSPAPTLTANPFLPTDEASALEYENGYTLAQELGTQGINAAQPNQWEAWASRSTPWKQGFSLALQGLGLGRLTATLEPQQASKVSHMNTALIPYGVFAFRDEENDLPEELKLAFSFSGLAGGVGGAALGAGVGGLTGAFSGGHFGMNVGPNAVTRAAAGVTGSVLGGALGSIGGAAVGGLAGHMLGKSVGDGGAYGPHMDHQIDDALNKGLISMDEADAIRGNRLNTAKAVGSSILPTLGGAAIGGLAGGALGGSTTKSQLLGAGAGALAGGLLGHSASTGFSAKGDMDEELGRITTEDPSRANPSFAPKHEITWGDAGKGVVGGAALGGLAGALTPRGAGSYAIPGAIAGGLLGGAANLRSRVTGTTPIDDQSDPSKAAEFEASLSDDIDDSNWATELLKVAGMGTDLLVGGPAALATAAAPVGLGIAGGSIGRNAYASGHPELTDIEKSKAQHAGGLGRSLATLGAGALGAYAGHELGGMGADNLVDAGAVPESTSSLFGDMSAHDLGAGLGTVAGGLGAADLVGRQGAEAAVMRHRGGVARSNAGA